MADGVDPIDPQHPDNDAGVEGSRSSPASATFEDLFGSRYTNEDADYKKVIESGIDPPPCIHPWFGRPKRNFDYTQQRNYQNRKRPHDDRRDERHHDRRRDERYGSEQHRRDGRRHDGHERHLEEKGTVNYPGRAPNTRY